MSAWLPLLPACNLQCLTPLFFVSYFSRCPFILKDMLALLMLALEGQSLKFSVNMLTSFILYYYAAAGPGCLINCCKLCCFLYTHTKRSTVSIYKLKVYLLLLFRLYFIQTVEQAASPFIKTKVAKCPI